MRSSDPAHSGAGDRIQWPPGWIERERGEAAEDRRRLPGRALVRRTVRGRYPWPMGSFPLAGQDRPEKERGRRPEAPTPQVYLEGFFIEARVDTSGDLPSASAFLTTEA